MPVKRIASLDGLRAVSIIVVTVSHLQPGAVSFGSHGVDVFFVISGYLITHLLLNERERSGTISIPKFYIRRVQRIIPAFAFFLLITLTLFRFGFVDLDISALPLALTYTYNLFPHKNLQVFGPIWSLCVEEHFYLLWPAAVLLLRRRKLVGVLIGVFPMAAIVRAWLEIHHSPLNPDFFTLTRLDTIAAGCLFAILLHSTIAERLRKLLRTPWLLPVSFGCYMLSACVLTLSGKYHLFLQHAVEALLIAAMMGSLIEQPRSLCGRFLNSKPLVQIGLLSYSLYLGQFIIIDLHGVPLAARIALLMTYALVSYYMVESPILRIGRTSARSAPAPTP